MTQRRGWEDGVLRQVMAATDIRQAPNACWGDAIERVLDSP